MKKKTTRHHVYVAAGVQLKQNSNNAYQTTTLKFKTWQQHKGKG